MTRLNTVILAILIAVSTSSVFAQSQDPIDELKACARMTDRDARFACFDELGERVLRAESTDKEPAQVKTDKEPAQVKKAEPEAIVAAAEITRSPPDDPGTPTLGDDQESKSITYSATITSCKQGHYGDWYFTLENGQVWKEVSRRKLRFEECEFDVTIAKDLFGYKMWIDAAEKPIRIKRQQ